MGMSGLQPQQQLTVRTPKKRSMRFFNFNSSDLFWLVLSLMVVSAVVIIIGSTWSRIFVPVAIVVWCLTMLPVENLNDRVYFGPIAFVDNLSIRLRGNVTWRANAPGSSEKRSRKVRIMKLSVQSFGD